MIKAEILGKRLRTDVAIQKLTRYIKDKDFELNDNVSIHLNFKTISFSIKLSNPDKTIGHRGKLVNKLHREGVNTYLPTLEDQWIEREGEKFTFLDDRSVQVVVSHPECPVQCLSNCR